MLVFTDGLVNWVISIVMHLAWLMPSLFKILVPFCLNIDLKCVLFFSVSAIEIKHPAGRPLAQVPGEGCRGPSTVGTA